MADYPISNVTRRVVYAASGVGPYAFTFEILAQTDVAVFKDDTLLTLTTDYTVVINANGTGTITLTVVPTGATQIAIVGARAIERISDFTTGGDFFANTVNQELDSITIFAQQNAEAVARALQAPQTDPTTIDMTLPRASVRADKYLSFDVDGNPVAAEGRTEVAGVFAIRDEIVAVAAIDTDVVTVAGIDANVTTVAGIAANVTTVAGISASVTAVAADATDIGTVAANLAGADTIGTVAAIDADITAVAAIDTDVTAVAADATDIGTVAANLAGADTIGTVAGSIANVNLTGGSIANVNTAATNIANINTVATSISNVNAVGTNIAAVNTNATNIAAIQTASANATAAANSATASAASASAASDSADAAATSAETAAAATNAVLWVSGTTYAISFLVYSPLDNRVYRRLTAGAGTTDPSADATNWVQLTRVVEQSDIGTAPNEIPLNQYLGNLAYQDAENIAGDVGVGGNLSYTGTLTGGTGVINIGSGQVYKDASGNLGLGVTPSAWDAAIKAIQINNQGAVWSISSANPNVAVTSNARLVGATYSYVNTGVATQYAQSSGQHQFFTAPSGTAGSAISFTQAMTLDTSGNLLVGTTSTPNGTSAYGSAFINNGDDRRSLFMATSTTSARALQEFYNPNGNVGSIFTSASSTGYSTSSDYRLKENVQPMTGALSTVAQLNPVTYNWKSDGSAGQGFIAHELQAVVPDCVAGEKDAVDKDGKPIHQGVDTSFLVATLTAAIQELKAELDTVKAELNTLKGN
jgi:hypothetical protein